MPKRIQRKRQRGWRMPDGAIYVGRPTKWGNVWQLRRDSFGWMVQDTVRNWYPSSERVARRFAVWKFRKWMRGEFAQRRLAVKDLRGKDLACWCKIGAPCHADVLLELANAPASDAR